MKKFLFSLILLFPFLLNAQVSVKGIVTEQNSGNKPINGVQIKALGANPEVSDNSGLFQLIFGAKKPGDRVIVSEIKKKGYEIVNKKEVDSWLIGSNPNQRTKIVMCPEGLIAENTAKYYDISLKAVTDGYNKRINSLQEQLAKAKIDAKSYGEQSKALSDQFTNQQNQLEELADKFARENFDDCSAIQKQAFEAFKQGNIEEAIRILETVDSEAEIAKAKEQKSKGESLVNVGKNMQNQADSVIQQNIAKLMFQGDMYATNYRFEDAEKAYEKAVMADSAHFENVFEFAIFLGKQKKYDKAIKWYYCLYNNSAVIHNKALALNNIGQIQLEQGQFGKAEINFYKAFDIRCADSINTDLFIQQQNLVITYINLATLKQSTNRYSEAEEDFQFIIQELDSLVLYDSLKFRPLLANAYNNLSLLQSETNKYEEALRNGFSALNIYEGLDSIEYIESKISTINNIALIYSKTMRFREAEFFYLKACPLVRKLVSHNPNAYNPLLAMVLLNIATIQDDINKNQEAEKNNLEPV